MWNAQFNQGGIDYFDVIQVIFNQTKYSYNEIREYVKNAIYDLQYFGGADVIESCMIEENFDEACDILRNKRVGI